MNLYLLFILSTNVRRSKKLPIAIQYSEQFIYLEYLSNSIESNSMDFKLICKAFTIRYFQNHIILILYTFTKR